MSKTPEEVPVLVVGGAVTGLSTAVFLGWHGIRSLVVERHPDTLSHPRSRGVNPRTVELYRQVGLEDRLWSEASLATDFSKLLMIRAETLAGQEIFSGPTDQPDPSGSVSPCEWAPIDQDRLEHLLRERAGELGAELAFSTELVSFEQDDSGVTAVLKDTGTGAERTVRAKYLVAADGSRSPIRNTLGIESDGPGEFATTVSVLFEADLSKAARGRPVGVCYLDKPAPSTILFAHDGRKRWIFATGMPPGDTLDDITEEKAVELVRAAIGEPDLEVGIIAQLPAGGAKWLSFVIGAQVARDYRQGRVFLVGDAAHLVPPTGGFGASLGIQDANNLAWKLAAVLDGEAGPELLDTYQAERHPVAWMTLQQALGMMQERTGDEGRARTRRTPTAPRCSATATAPARPCRRSSSVGSRARGPRIWSWSATGRASPCSICTAGLRWSSRPRAARHGWMRRRPSPTTSASRSPRTGSAVPGPGSSHRGTGWPRRTASRRAAPSWSAPTGSSPGARRAPSPIRKVNWPPQWASCSPVPPDRPSWYVGGPAPLSGVPGPPFVVPTPERHLSWLLFPAPCW